MKRIALIGFFVIVIVVGYFVLKNPETKEGLLQKTTGISVFPSPTPIPFAEMTVPFLRSRSYKSNLGTLEKYQDHAAYTSYLTSFESDGLKVNGLLTIPKDHNAKHPAIVFVHGYIAPTIYKTTERYVEYVDYLSRNGFVVFKIDLRGNGNSEGDPSGAYYSGDYVIDTLNAYAALQSADFVDSSKIGLWGHSMAGNIVSRVFAAKPDIPAVVIWAGAGYTYTDLLTYRINDQSYRPPTQNSNVVKKRDLLNKTYGSFDPSSPFWSEVAVTNYLKDLKGAIEIHHAVNDPVVSIEYSRNLMKLLDATSVNHELFEYPSGGHNISGGSFSLAMARTVEFFNKYLK